MGHEVTLGGDRIGSGKKEKIYLHGYERSNNNLSSIFRTTMAAGTIVPFMKLLALPGDTFDIDLDGMVLTPPTTGPLYGSFKFQLDTFVIPIRLYNQWLHNNKKKVGLKMSDVKLPLMRVYVADNHEVEADKIDTSQVNPSSLLAYLGIRGFGKTSTTQPRDFNAVPLLGYWDIVANFYANKQEEKLAVIHTPSVTLIETVGDVTVSTAGVEDFIQPYPTTSNVTVVNGSVLIIGYTTTAPLPNQIIINTNEQGDLSAEALCYPFTDHGTYISAPIDVNKWGNLTAQNWRYIDTTDIGNGLPAIVTFPLSKIDERRDALMANSGGTHYIIAPDNTEVGAPYGYLLDKTNGRYNALSSQEGLALKTYQSDLFNNWMKTEYIDGPGGISEVTAISTAGDSFTIDTLNISKKIYDMLNRIAVSGGSYMDWMTATYDQKSKWQALTPYYVGGLSKELVFDEVVSNSSTGQQPLGTIAARGMLNGKHKGGKIVVKIEEPSYIMGLCSLTPRLDYSQGNDWDTYTILTMDDLHKPQLDEIGFQDLIEEQMAWWTTEWNGTKWEQKAAGKQPAWQNYRTDYNKTYGNFAIPDNQMFMTLNRRYEYNAGEIKDLTTYIDPVKYNYIFAETSLDAQNFWVQIKKDIFARRKLSNRVMPNL